MYLLMPFRMKKWTADAPSDAPAAPKFRRGGTRALARCPWCRMIALGLLLDLALATAAPAGTCRVLGSSGTSIQVTAPGTPAFHVYASGPTISHPSSDPRRLRAQFYGALRFDGTVEARRVSVPREVVAADGAVRLF